LDNANSKLTPAHQGDIQNAFRLATTHGENMIARSTFACVLFFFTTIANTGTICCQEIKSDGSKVILQKVTTGSSSEIDVAADNRQLPTLPHKVQADNRYAQPTLFPGRPAQRPVDPLQPQVGSLAPEIEGVDIDGVKFKLSDYRGEVIVLDFWGDW
jgi:hypothetical protein